ncbi:hypothetical protein HK102_001840, partial [Quaeritorhiza haematococci]
MITLRPYDLPHMKLIEITSAQRSEARVDFTVGLYGEREVTPFHREMLLSAGVRFSRCPEKQKIHVDRADNRVPGGHVPQLITPELSGKSDSYFIDYNKINKSLNNAPSVAGAAPRWIFPATIKSAESDSEGTTESLFILVLDSGLEKFQSGSENGTSDALKTAVAPLLSDTIVISEGQARGLDPRVRDTINQNFKKDEKGNYVVSREEVLTQIETLNSTIFSQNFTVVDAIESPAGKYPATIGNVAVLEYKFTEILINRIISEVFQTSTLNLVLQTTNPEAAKSISDATSLSIDLKKYAITVVVLKKNRLEMYMKPSKDRKRELIAFSNELAERISIDAPVVYTDVLGSALEATSFIQLFLNE